MCVRCVSHCGSPPFSFLPACLPNTLVLLEQVHLLDFFHRQERHRTLLLHVRVAGKKRQKREEKMQSNILDPARHNTAQPRYVVTLLCHATNIIKDLDGTVEAAIAMVPVLNTDTRGEHDIAANCSIPRNLTLGPKITKLQQRPTGSRTCPQGKKGIRVALPARYISS